jgi:predicted DNA-binding transcriptional regulator AlpA
MSLKLVRENIISNASSVKVLRNTDLDDVLKISKSTRYRLMKKGEFPKPFFISDQAVGWLSTDITSWIESRKSGSQEVAA